jgi:regulator of sigma E protease
MPKLIDNQFTVKSDTRLADREVLISYIEPGSPADKAGLRTQDAINDIALDGYSPVAIDSADNLPKITKSFAGKRVTIFYSREGHNREAHAKLRSSGSDGYLGVIPTELSLQRSTWSAPVVAVGLSAQLTGLTFQGLGHALGGLGSLIAGAVTGNHTAREHGQTAASDQVAGPVGIFVILKNGSLIGYQFMLFIVAYISLMLAIMNILPVPALDGGRLWITLIARGLKRPLTARREEAINAAGFAVLLALIIVITVVDVKRFL